MLACVNKAITSSSNAQTIGRNGEIPLRDFLNHYLPYTFRAATGHFVTPEGELSPQLDVMILDTRYPLLAHNADGSVLSMLHAVVATIEVKTRIATRDVQKMWLDAIKVTKLSRRSVFKDDWGGIDIWGFAYGCANRLDALEAEYERVGQPNEAPLDISLMRLHPNDATRERPLGVELHFEPDFDEKDESKLKGYILTSIPQFTPLNDLYYRLVQNSYYTLGRRDIDYTDIGVHVMDYMSWSTCAWDEYYKQMKEERRHE